MANSRVQRKANRTKLRAELWSIFNKVAQKNIGKSCLDCWDIFVRKHMDMDRFKSDPMYRQEIFALKQDFKDMIIETIGYKRINSSL